MIDTNVLLDVLGNRQPHYIASAACLDAVVKKRITGCIPAHTITTLFYLLQKVEATSNTRNVIRWLLQTFEIISCGQSILVEACESHLNDYEDAVVALSAKQATCQYIITRNISDFLNSPVPAVSPTKFLDILRS